MWTFVLVICTVKSVDLTNTKLLVFRFEAKKDDYNGYSVWGVAITEVEVDILTGEMFIVRADVIEDAGLSTSPLVRY